jgi:pSer/pThr/pTyr-binding forkhead associated (FHA) protein
MSVSATPSVQRSWLELPDGGLFWLKGRCAIGRDADNDLVLNATALSRHHALLTVSPAGATLADLHSSNGTYLNSERVKRPASLRDGDKIQFGDRVVRFRCTRGREINDGEEVVDVTRRLDDVRPRVCWLLVTDIVGFSPLNEQIGSEAAVRLLQVWIADVRLLLEQNDARINSYVGDAIFAYWPCDFTAPPQVLAAMGQLEVYRKRSPLPFRVVMHHGCALFTRSEKGEELTGQEVNFVFRAEKVAKHFQVPAMLSHAAVQTMNLESRCNRLGASRVDGMSGTFDFFGFPSDLIANAAE